MKFNKIHNIKLLLFLLIAAIYPAAAQQRVLTLEEAKSLAIENNKGLKKALTNVEAAKAAKVAADASNKPTLDAGLYGIYISNPLNAILPEYQASGTLALTQVLYAGNKINTARKMAGSSIDLVNAQKELTEDEVLLQVETTYWQIVNLKDKVIVAKEYIRLLATLQTTLQNSFDAGLSYKNDLLQVNVQQNDAELNLMKINNGLFMAKKNLAQLMGIAPTEEIDVRDTGKEDITPMALGNPDLSVDNRPEIKILTKNVELNELQTELLKGNTRPTIAFSANGFHAAGKGINVTNSKDYISGFVGLVSVSIPIFDWGNRKNKVKEQGLKTEAQKIGLEDTKEILQLEVQNNYLLLQQSVKRIELAQKSFGQAEENLRINQDRFDAGTVLADKVLEAQVLWQRAFSSIIDSHTEYKINEARYKKSIGEY